MTVTQRKKLRAIATNTRLTRIPMAIFLKACLLLGGCATTKTPMPANFYPGPESSGKVLVVALRGLGGSVEDFEKYGFVEALHEHDPSIDLICPDAHFGYYRKRNLLPRLSEDILEPARAKGYKRIYLTGVSLGGLGSLLSLREYPELFDGAVLLAPYSGESDLHEAIKAYLADGGTPPWDAGMKGDEQDLAELWRWLLDADSTFKPNTVWLGYGDQDRLSGHDLLADLLPEQQVFVRVDGKHRATVFAELWEQILEQSPFESGTQTK